MSEKGIREPAIENEAILNCKLKCFASFLCMMALSTVIGAKILSYYPACGDRRIEKIFNCEITPRVCNDVENELNILWCNTTELKEGFKPNHFVLLSSNQGFEVYQQEAKHQIKEDCTVPFQEPSTSICSEKPPIIVLEPEHQSKKHLPFKTPLAVKGLAPPQTSQKREGKITTYFSKKESKGVPNQMQSDEVLVKASLKRIDSDVKAPIQLKRQRQESDLPVLESKNYDIGSYHGKTEQLKDIDKYHLIRNVWKPEENFAFPYRQEGRKMRKCVYSWLKSYKWLTYSRVLDGCFCLPCMLFGMRSGHNATKPVRLVSEPLIYWTSASCRLLHHQESKLHLNSVLQMHDFTQMMENQQLDIRIQQNKAISEQVIQNRAVLSSIIKTVVLCGKQNISMRGHRDDSQHLSDPKNNPGNFQMLLDFRVDSGDEILRDHFKKCKRNASYRSKTIQNEIISICGSHIQETLIKEIKKSGFFSILADEATDQSNKEQMPIVLRFVDDNYEIREEFATFIYCNKGISGKDISGYIKKELTELGLDLTKCRGQGFDGAGNVAGKYNGAARLFQNEYPLATFVHCASHRLNLCVAKSCSIQKVKNMMHVVKEVSDFFNNSPKRQEALLSMIAETMPEQKRSKLTDVCRTRWIERIEGLDDFLELYPAVVRTLEMIKINDVRHWNDDSCTKANGLYASCTNFQFIITIIITCNILNYTLEATRKLQRREIDIVKGYAEIDRIIATVVSTRENINQKHREWYEEAERFADSVNITPSMPRTCSRQLLRDNQPADTPEDYYRRTVSIPFLDHVNNELQTRFDRSSNTVVKGFHIIPEIMRRNADQREKANVDWRAKFLEFVRHYEVDFPSERIVKADLDLWETYWLKMHIGVVPSTVAETLKQVKERSLSNQTAITALKLLGTVPVTTCECERSVSSLRRLKTYMRSTMAQERLNGLALLHTHRQMSFNIEELVDKFAREQPRRMRLYNILDSE